MAEDSKTDRPEMSVREFRASLAEVLNEAAVYGKTTFITSRGRRIAAIVPVPLAEEAATKH